MKKTKLKQVKSNPKTSKCNPKKPLDFYLKNRTGLENYKLYENITSYERLSLKNSIINNNIKLHIKPFILNYNNSTIPYYVGYITTRYYSDTKYILGVIELYKNPPDKQSYVEVHDFINNIREFSLTPTKQTVDLIFNRILDFFKRAVFENGAESVFRV